jgi:hypothetical protein
MTSLWTENVLVSYEANWEGHYISDHFLWPKSNSSVWDMKVFAVNFLSDYLRDDFKKYESH